MATDLLSQVASPAPGSFLAKQLGLPQPGAAPALLKPGALRSPDPC